MNLRFEILKAVAANPGAPINEIADAISYDRQKAAWSVRDCAQDGLLAKRLDDVTRQPGYTLTDAGKKRLAEGPAKLQGGNLKKGAKTKTSFNAGPRDRADAKAKVEAVSEPAAAEATVKESLTVAPERAPELPAEVSTAGQAAEDDRKEIDLILVRPRVLEDLEISKRARDSYRESRDVLSRELDTIRALLAHRVTGPIDPSDFTEVELAEKAAEMIDEAVNEISHALTAVREKDDELLKQARVVVELRDQLANQTALVEKLEHLLQSARNEAEHLRRQAHADNTPTDKNANTEQEYTGGSVSYYKVLVKHPTDEGRAPYVAECNDVIEALHMDFAEGNAFKAIWRKAAARLGKQKRGYDDGLYDAEKVLFFGGRMVIKASAAQSPHEQAQA
jgi:hypothetical protein